MATLLSPMVTLPDSPAVRPRSEPTAVVGRSKTIALRAQGDGVFYRGRLVVFPAEGLHQVGRRAVQEADPLGAGRIAGENQAVIVGAETDDGGGNPGRIAAGVEVVDAVGDAGQRVRGADGHHLAVDDDIAGIAASQRRRLAGEGVGGELLRLGQVRDLEAVGAGRRRGGGGDGKQVACLDGAAVRGHGGGEDLEAIRVLQSRGGGLEGQKLGICGLPFGESWFPYPSSSP